MQQQRKKLIFIYKKSFMMCKCTLYWVILMLPYLICANIPLEKHYYPNKELEGGRAEIQMQLLSDSNLYIFITCHGLSVTHMHGRPLSSIRF